MEKLMKKIIYTFLLLISFSSYVNAYECTGKVNNVVINPAGIVTLSFGNINWVYLCSVSESYNGVTPESCKAMFSLLIAAKLSDRNITMWFSDDSANCTNTKHTAWETLKNWYYGPALI